MSTAIWRGLYELLLSAVPDACVNLLHNEADPANPIALELRPRARMVETLPVLLAKWTVIVSEVRPTVMRVTVVKMDREVLDQRDFDSSGTMEVAEYIKGHPFMNSRWSFCHGMRSGELKPEKSEDSIGDSGNTQGYDRSFSSENRISSLNPVQNVRKKILQVRSKSS